MPRERLTEFTGYEVSEWHRTRGEHLPCVDMDFVVIEYDLGMPKAIIEHKHENWRCQNWNSPSFIALREVAAPRRYELPFYVVKNKHDCSEFKVKPMNLSALRMLSGNFQKTMTEQEYDRFLHKLRSE